MDLDGLQAAKTFLEERGICVGDEVHVKLYERHARFLGLMWDEHSACAVAVFRWLTGADEDNLILQSAHFSQLEALDLT